MKNVYSENKAGKTESPTIESEKAGRIWILLLRET